MLPYVAFCTKSIKSNFLQGVRPKPEFFTVRVRTCVLAAATVGGGGGASLLKIEALTLLDLLTFFKLNKFTGDNPTPHGEFVSIKIDMEKELYGFIC